LPIGADAGEGFEGSAETLLRTLGGFGDAFHLAFRAGEKRNEQVGLTQRVGTEDDCLGLLEGHGGIVEQVLRFQGEKQDKDNSKVKNNNKSKDNSKVKGPTLTEKRG
jgi:hypothetical protein